MDQHFNSSFPIVNIHWPESIFNWEEPSIEELGVLSKEIKKWKKSAVIVYTKHDKGRVKGWTKNFKSLFNIVEENSDAFVHLGEFSRNHYSKKFPDKIHKVIPHPTFNNSFLFASKEKARAELGIDQDSFVVTAPGQIRSKSERKLLLNTFDRLDHPKKILISTNMRNELEWELPVRLEKFFKLKSSIKRRFQEKHQPPKFNFSYAPLDNYNFSLRIAAADIVFIPRIDLLNTGNVLLGLTFNKITVGPAIGNIKEQLEEHNLPSFNPNTISSAIEALERGVLLKLEGYKPIARKKHLAKNVSKAYDDFFKGLIEGES